MRDWLDTVWLAPGHAALETVLVTFDDSATGDVVRVRPSRRDARSKIVPVARKNYFRDGGFTVSRREVQVQARSGRRTTVRRAEIAAVALTHSSRGDTRVLLTRRDGSVLAQDQSWFYSDDALQRLATAIGCPFQEEPYQGIATLERNHPGTLRYQWERHPYLLVIAFTVAAVIAVLIAALAR